MRKPVAAVIACVLLAAAAYCAWPDEARAIRTRLDALASIVSVPANDPPAGRITRIAQLRHFFTEDVHVRFGTGGPEIESRDALLGAIGAWAPPPGGWTVEFVDVNVTLGPDRTSADAYLTAKVTGADPVSGQPTVDAREADLTMVKRDGEWVISRAEARETLER